MNLIPLQPKMTSTLSGPPAAQNSAGIEANIKEITALSDFQHTGTSALKLPAASGSSIFDDILTSVFQVGGKLLWPNDNVRVELGMRLRSYHLLYPCLAPS
jgi:hypothetical protein